MSLPADPGNFSAGLPATAAGVNARFAPLYAALSAGGLDPAAFAAAAIPLSKLATDAKAKAGSAVQTGGAYTLTTSYADLPGAGVTWTPPVASWALLLGVATFRFSIGATASAAGYAYIDVDGVQQGFAGRALFGQSGGVSVAFEQTVFCMAIVALTAAAHTAKLKVRAGSTLGFVDDVTFGAPASGLYYLTLPS